MTSQADVFEQARQSRDPRFDGMFFIGVLTTGIYCRPICPVKIPKKQNVILYRSAAEATEAGFRPCLRCRPESSPGTPNWQGASWKVSKALQLIDQGFLDSATVTELAAQLNVGPRQLNRLFHGHLGASPVTLAQTRRLHFAKKLLDETLLPLNEVCFAAGFGSVRRFNAVFRQTYARTPKELRSKAVSRLKSSSASKEDGIVLKLSYRPPFDWRSMLEFLSFRAVPGVEVVSENSYARTLSIGGEQGEFVAQFDTGANYIFLRINFPNTRALYQIVERVRNLFDLKADSTEIYRSLARDEALRPLLNAQPGLRVPGCWDGFEVTVRAILGQQVSVKSATTLVARIAERHGTAYRGSVAGLHRVFPSAEVLLPASLDGLGIVGARIAAIKSVAQQLVEGKLNISNSSDSATFVGDVCKIKGIGPWTAQYIALRSLNDPNAFPEADLILLRAAAALDGDAQNRPEGGIAKVKALTVKQMIARAEIWQPWRAYVVFLLWKFYQSELSREQKNG